MDIITALNEYNNAMDVLDNAEQAVQGALANIKANSNGSTVSVEGKFFQVRARKEKLYLCELTGRPRGRPKGSKNKRPRLDKRNGDNGEANMTESDVTGADTPVYSAQVSDINDIIDAAAADTDDLVYATNATTGTFERAPVDESLAIDAVMLDDSPNQHVG